MTVDERMSPRVFGLTAGCKTGRAFQFILALPGMVRRLRRLPASIRAGAGT